MTSTKSAWIRRARAARLLSAAGVILAVLMLVACHRAPAEQQVRDAIESAAVAARANDTGALLAFVSDNFSGNGGELDRHGLRQLLAVRALRQDKTGVLIGPVSFEHKSDRIIAKFNLVLTGGKPGDLLPDQSAIYAMTTAWRREGGRWVCYNAAWSR
ncbi:MAG: hypothetical protein OJF61_001064 [Rhodanobacteraceae bacterium]|jgi:ketosteroid isomerase-like protein|nr:MAG: hypothetical protein OJF61_001064 [Rhodanobacteraceae bacterium]